MKLIINLAIVTTFNNNSEQKAFKLKPDRTVDDTLRTKTVRQKPIVTFLLCEQMCATLTGEHIRITFLACVHHTIASLPHPYQSLLSFQYIFWLTQTSFPAIISDWRGFPVLSTKVKHYVKMRQAGFLFVISAVVSTINKTPKHK